MYAGKKVIGFLFIIVTSFLLISGIFYDRLVRNLMIIAGSWLLLALLAAVSANSYNIKYKNEMKALSEPGVLCPNCKTNNPVESEECLKCHKNLKEILFYKGYEGLLDIPDIEINKNEIIEYKKGITGKRNGKTEKYSDLIHDVEIKNYAIEPYVQINFKYRDKKGNIKKKFLVVDKYNIEELKKALDLKNIQYSDVRRRK